MEEGAEIDELDLRFMGLGVWSTHLGPLFYDLVLILWAEE